MAARKLQSRDKTRKEIEELRQYLTSLEGEDADIVKAELEKFLPGSEEGDRIAARRNFLPFVRQVWPDFIAGRHHDVMAETFERIERGEIDPSFVITHRATLEEGPELYKTFRAKQDGCIKVVMKP